MGWLVRSMVISVVAAFVVVCIAVCTPGWLVMKVDTEKTIQHAKENQYIPTTGYESSGLNDNNGFNKLRHEEHGRHEEDNSNPIPYPKVSVDFSLLYFVVCVESACFSSSVEGIQNAANLQKSYSSKFSKSSYANNMLHNNPYFSQGLDSWKQLRAEGIAAMAFCFVGMVLALIYARQHKNGTRVTGIIAAILMPIGGILSAVLVWQFSTTYNQLHQYSSLFTSAGLEIGTPYSMILMGLGSALCFLATVMLGVALRHQQPMQNGQVIARPDGGGHGPVLPLHGVANKLQGYSELPEERYTVPYGQPIAVQ